MQRGFSTLVIILSLVLLGGLIGGAFYLGKINYSSQSVVNNFEDCTKAGYPVMESYPAQCRTPDGKVFIQQLSEEEKSKLVPPVSDKFLDQEQNKLRVCPERWFEFLSPIKIEGPYFGQKGQFIMIKALGNYRFFSLTSGIIWYMVKRD